MAERNKKDGVSDSSQGEPKKIKLTDEAKAREALAQALKMAQDGEHTFGVESAGNFTQASERKAIEEYMKAPKAKSSRIGEQYQAVIPEWKPKPKDAVTEPKQEEHKA